MTFDTSFFNIVYFFAHFSQVRADGYRQFVLCTLKTVRSLDNEIVTARARSSAEELYVERVLAFNDRVDQIRRDNERCVVVVVVVLSKKMLFLVLSLYHEKYIFIYIFIILVNISYIYIYEKLVFI